MIAAYSLTVIAPNIIIEQILETSREQAFEYISNYRYRNDWTEGVDEFQFKLNEVTRLDTVHTCVVNGKHIDFVAVIKDTAPGQIVYGEYTENSPADELYQFYLIESLPNNKSKVTVEIYWKARSPFKKLILKIFARKSFEKGITASLNNLSEFVKRHKL